ncbi:competence protein CoiA [Bacillus infantis]
MECIYEGGGETESHRLGKVKLFNYLESLLNHKVIKIEIEHYIPETRQIADIFIEFENGVQWVVEYQRSNINPEKIQERKKLYQKAGIKDIWVIGENLINSSGLVTYTVKRAAEALIENSFDQPSIVSFNPATDIIEIFRGLERVNNRTYTVNEAVMGMDLKDVGINLYGEFFGAEDVESVDIDKSNFSESTLTFDLEVEAIRKCEIPGYAFEAPIFNEETSEFTYLPFQLPTVLYRVVPVEMKDLMLRGFYLFNHKELSMSEQFIVLGVSKRSWKNKVYKKRPVYEPEIPFMETPMNKGILLWAIDHLYEHFYQTEEEFKLDYEYIQRGRPVPFYTKIHRYNKNNLLGPGKPIVTKTQFSASVSLSSVLALLLSILRGTQVNNSTKEAVFLGIIFQEELYEPFTLAIFEKVIIRFKKLLTPSPDYHGFYSVGVGMFVE